MTVGAVFLLLLLLLLLLPPSILLPVLPVLPGTFVGMGDGSRSPPPCIVAAPSNVPPKPILTRLYVSKPVEEKNGDLCSAPPPVCGVGLFVLLLLLLLLLLFVGWAVKEDAELVAIVWVVVGVVVVAAGDDLFGCRFVLMLVLIFCAELVSLGDVEVGRRF